MAVGTLVFMTSFNIKNNLLNKKNKLLNKKNKLLAARKESLFAQLAHNQNLPKFFNISTNFVHPANFDQGEMRFYRSPIWFKVVASQEFFEVRIVSTRRTKWTRSRLRYECNGHNGPK